MIKNVLIIVIPLPMLSKAHKSMFVVVPLAIELGYSTYKAYSSVIFDSSKPDPDPPPVVPPESPPVVSLELPPVVPLELPPVVPLELPPLDPPLPDVFISKVYSVLSQFT